MRSRAMRSGEQNRQLLDDMQVPVRLKLTALWVSTIFLYVYVDILAFYKPGTIDGILVGRVWEFDISQTWALGALALMTIPILMVLVSVALTVRIARWTNVVVACLFVPVAIGNAVGEAWAFYWFGSALEVVLLLLIIRYALTWPGRVDSVGEQKSPEDAVTSMRLSMPKAIDGEAAI